MRCRYKSKTQLQRALFNATNVHYALSVHKAIRGFVQLSALPTVLKPVLGECLGLLISLLMNSLNTLAPFKPRSALGSCMFAAISFKLLHLLTSFSQPVTLAVVLVLCFAQPFLRPVARAIQAKVLCLDLVCSSSSQIPKFSSPESFHIVLAGAEAGKFSSFLPGG